MLQIGIVGAGGMGTVHISNYAHIDGCHVAAVCDPAEQGKKKAAEIGAAYYPDIQSMLSHEKLDIVDVCTPTFLHKPSVMAALEAEVNVICEKPIALTSADAKEMCETAKSKGVQLFVGHVLQYFLDAMILKDLVKSGEYGRVLDASFLRLSACPRWVKNGWLFDKSRSGLLPFDLHIHDLDLIVSLFGKPKKASWTSCGREGLTYKEHYRFLYEYDQMNVAAEAAWYNADFPFTATWRVYFENAVVTSDSKGVIAYQFDHEPRIFDTKETILIPTGINVPPTGSYYRELVDFTNHIKEGGPAGCMREQELLDVLSILEKIN